MRPDAFGNAVSTQAPATVAAIDRFTETFLCYGTEFGAIFAGVEADPDCALAHAHAAALGLFMETRAGLELAAQHLARAEAGRADTERERLLVASLRAWSEDDYARACALLERVAAQHPRDLFAVKLGQTHYFNLGDAPGMLRFAEAILDANADTAYAWGMLAFALEQCHRLDEALAAGRKAVALQRREPWAHHAVAHVLETRGAVREGIDWLEGLAETWQGCNSFMYTHNYWHLALFHLELDDAARVLELYDRHVWGIDKGYSQDQAGAVSLLWRLELRGFDVGGRFDDVAGHVAARDLCHVQPFLDLHFAFALARAGRDAELERLLDGVARRGATAHPCVREVWRDVCLPGCHGLSACARGDAEAAHAALAPVMPRLASVGGSHAQRDLFAQAWLDVLLETQRFDAAIPLLERRARERPELPHPQRQLAAAYAGAGRDADASRCRETAAALRERLGIA